MARLLDADAARMLKPSIKTHGLDWQDNEILAQEAKLADTFKTAGMTVIQPDIESFRKPVLASVPAKFEAQMGQGTLGAHRRDVTCAAAIRRRSVDADCCQRASLPLLDRAVALACVALVVAAARRRARSASSRARSASR